MLISSRTSSVPMLEEIGHGAGVCLRGGAEVSSNGMEQQVNVLSKDFFYFYFLFR